jgi:hypothetical protein
MGIKVEVTETTQNINQHSEFKSGDWIVYKGLDNGKVIDNCYARLYDVDESEGIHVHAYFYNPKYPKGADWGVLPYDYYSMELLNELEIKKYIPEQIQQKSLTFGSKQLDFANTPFNLKTYLDDNIRRTTIYNRMLSDIGLI